MFGKLFDSMFDGSLRSNWQAMVTFQQMVILCDSEGVVDMTPEAIHYRTGIPLEIIKEGIDELEKEDPASRTPALNGRRIVRLDEHRQWGWRIVNHAYYKALATREEKKRRDRDRVNEKRSKDREESQPVAKCRKVSPDVANVANVAHTDADADADADALSLDKSSGAASTGESRFAIPLQKGICRLPSDKLEEYETTYSWDVEPEIKKAIQWLRDNQGRRPRSSTGAKAFLTRWLNRTDDSMKEKSITKGGTDVSF